MNRIPIPSIAAYSLVFLLALVFTLQCVHCSVHFGRLVAVPNYDDVVYFSSGLDFSKSIHKEGLYGVYDHYERMGTHAPYSELLAGIVIFFFGYVPRAIYTSDVFLVFTYLCFIRYFLNRLPPFNQFILLLCFLTFPFATMAVVEFRPDLAWAALLGFACIYMVTRKDFFEKTTPAITVAVLIVFALLAKPATFPMTLLLPTFAFFGRLGIEMIKSDLSVEKLLLRGAFCGCLIFAILIVVMSPYIYSEGTTIWSYFWDNTWGKNADLWKYDRTDMWTFYLYGDGAQNNVYVSGSIFLTATLSFTLVYIRNLSWMELFEMVLGFGLLIIAYVISSKAPVKSPFMGGAIYGTEIFLLAHLAGRMLPEAMPLYLEGGISKIYSPLWLNVTTIILFIGCAVNYHWPPYSFWDRDRGVYLRSIHEAVYKYFETVPDPKSICLTSASPIVSEDLNNWFHDHNQAPLIGSTALSHSRDESMALLSPFEYILAQNAGIRQNTGWLPAEKWEDQIVNTLMASSSYSLEMTYSDKLGKNLYIFKYHDSPITPLPEFKGGAWTLKGNQLTSPRASSPKAIVVGPVSKDLRWSVEFATVDKDKNEAVISGWSANTANGIPTKEILVFSGTQLEQVATVDGTRQDVSDSFAEPSLLQSGFLIRIPMALLKGGSPLTFIAVVNGQPAVDQSAFLPFDAGAVRNSLGLQK